MYINFNKSTGSPGLTYDLSPMHSTIWFAITVDRLCGVFCYIRLVEFCINIEPMMEIVNFLFLSSLGFI